MKNKIDKIIKNISEINLPNVFNPYFDTCPIFDKINAPKIRRRNLYNYLIASATLGVDTMWMGRDLGHRGGRRTGIALTDEAQLSRIADVYPGHIYSRVTKGTPVVERTATEIWSFLKMLELPPFLWNVFPFHPHLTNEPLTNRKFIASELAEVERINSDIMELLNVRRIVAIGKDAAFHAQKYGVEVLLVRHPSYGGTKEFRAGISAIYGLTNSGQMETQRKMSF